MGTLKVTLKWNKQVFENIELDLDQPPAIFKAQLFSITGVDPERQKVIIKGVTIKDETDFKTLKLKDGAVVMLMGTAGEIKEEPKPVIKFIEDMSDAELAKATNIPPGLENLGNTCYLNATLQCFRKVPELRDILKSYPGTLTNFTDQNNALTVAFRDLFKQMDNSGESFSPMTFVLAFRQLFPQFNEQQQGVYVQQDAEECLNQLFQSLGAKLKTGNSESFMKQFFGIEFLTKWTCDEDPSEPPKITTETNTKIACHINQDVNFLLQGIKAGLTEQIEKQSENLGRTALYTKTSKISRLPSYLMVNFVRFFWKKDIQKKAKILRKVKYPMDLDLYEICTEELQAKLQPLRAKILAEDKKDLKRKEPEKDQESKDVMETNPTSSSSSEMQVDKEIGCNATGFYELAAVLTHIGRSSDSGHYMAWVRKEESNDWWKFDDDKVTLVPSEEILKLDGGGDWHIAYVCLYREKKFNV